MNAQNINPAKQSTTDPARDVWRYEDHPLRPFFHPRTVAVVGATEAANSVGRTVLKNLITTSFGGIVFPVNPKRPSVLGIKAYASVAATPEPVDLAVVCTPAATVPGVITECVNAGVKNTVVISAGFKEMGAPGIELERKVLETARRGGMRIIGPNCLGVMNPVSGFNATFAACIARPGNVAFLSQSGALCTAVLDWSIKEQVGFSAFVSIGSMLDVDFGDLVDYFGGDPRTQSILIYMETIGDARSFLSAAREVALNKPIILIKPGRTEAAAKAAASHTGSMAGSDGVLDAAIRRAGILRVNQISELFDMAEVLAKQPPPRGPRLSIVTNAGGPGVLATDALIMSGGKLTELSPEAFKEFNAFLPPHWSRNNPIDILGDAGPEKYARALEVAAKDPNSDGMLVILTPQDMTDATRTAEALRPYANIPGKPVIASWMGGPAVAAGVDILNQSNIPTFAYPDRATRAFVYMWQYSDNLKHLYQTPEAATADDEGMDRKAASDLVAAVRAEGRTILTEYESKLMLKFYGIPTVETVVAETADAAVAASAKMGYPVVLKLHSKTITHKTDVGGVKLNLADEAAVRQAFADIRKAVSDKAGAKHFNGVAVQPMVKLEGYELIVGSSLDAQFGPVLLFGMGGQLVEVFKDRALGLPPLNGTLALRMMQETKIFQALKGVRGRKPVDMVALERIMIRFSQLVVEQPWIKESDINPLIASGEQLIAVDARFVLHEPGVQESDLPRAAIRPYPTQYRAPLKLKDGTALTVRPIRPDDERMMVEFHKSLSERSVYLRYTAPMDLDKRIAHERLTRICFTDYAREIVLVVVNQKTRTKGEIAAVGRLSRIHASTEAKFAVLVADAYQHKGLGSALMGQLVAIARAEGITRITSEILAENEDMQNLCRKLKMVIEPGSRPEIVTASLRLAGG